MRTALWLPVLIAFPEGSGKAESWGRFIELSAGSASLSTLTRLSARERIYLSFELGGERFRELSADVEDSELDADGYCRADLLLRDAAQRRGLAKALLDVLSRT